MPFFPPTFYPWSQFIQNKGELFSEEIRLVSSFNGPFQFLIGGYYEEKETGFGNIGLFGGQDLSLNSFAPNEIRMFENRFDRLIKQRALFGELSYDFTEQIKLTVGGRFFKYDREFVEQNILAAFSPDSVSEVTGDDSDTSLKVGLEYVPNDSALLYATWSEGFRLGYPVPAEALPASLCDPDGDGFYDGSNGISTSSRSIDSDFVDNYEIGGKFSLLNNHLTINTAAYQIDWEGIPILQIFDFCGATANAGEARSRGAEFEMTYHFSQELLVSFSASYVNAELTEDAIALSAQKGDRLPGSPKYNMSIGVEHDFSLGGHDAYIRSDYSLVGGFYNNLQEAGTEAGDYGILNVKAGILVDQFEFDLYINNLTNEDALTWIDTEISVFERGNRLRPRSVGFKVGYRF